jgi:3-phenylpropionate/cinnamic acid dioxygenase small subunit
MAEGALMDTDREQIVEALAEIAAALDSRDWDALREWFTADTHAYGVRGQDALVEQVQAHLGGVGATQHLLGNHRVTVDGDTARALTYWRAHHVGTGPMDGSSFEAMGEYDDHLVRTAEGWRISRRWVDVRISVGDFAVLRPAD